MLLTVVGLGVGASTASARTGVLPDPTHAAIVNVLEAFAALERAGVDDPPTKQDYAVVQASCDAMPQDSGLLRSHRALCAATLAANREIDRECSTKRACARLFERSAAAAKRVNALTVSANRTVDRDVPAGRCRTTLRTSAAELRRGRAIERAFRDMGRARRAGHERAYQQALGRLFRAISRRTATYADQAKAVNTHC